MELRTKIIFERGDIFMIKFFKIRYTSTVLALAILTLNPTAIKIYSSYREKCSLSSKINAIKQENEKYKKRLYYLENIPSHMDRMVKSELGVIATDEIEYIFEKS